MSTLTLGTSGELTIPAETLGRLGFAPDRPVRVVETRGGVLLIPLTDAPMSHELAAELADWQGLAAGPWESFPYDDQP